LTNKAYRYITITTMILLLLVGLFAGINYVLHLDRYVVKVNGQGISAEKFKVYMKIVKKQKEKLAGITRTEDIKKFWTEPVEGLDPVVFARQEALDSVINLMIIAQEAKEKGIQSSEIDQTLLRAKLESQGFIKELKDIGIEEQYINDIIRNLSLRMKLFNSLTKEVVLSDSEFQKILDSNADVKKAKAQDLERIKMRMHDSYTEKKRNNFFEQQMTNWKQKAHIEKNEQLINSINIIDIK